MSVNLKQFALGLIATTALAAGSASAQSSGPMLLTNRQMDNITAGGVFVVSDVQAQALAQYRTLAVGLSRTIAGANPGVETGFSSEGGLATGTAVTFGFNGANSGPPPSTSSTVTTGGSADGNYTVGIAGSGTVSALGLTIQGAFTSVYGVFVPGL